MKWAVLIMCALAGLALVLAQVAAPVLVLFPLAGLLLLAPSLFLYLLAIWAVSSLLPIREPWRANGAALVIVVGVASLAVLPLRLSALADLEARGRVPDIAPPARIALTGDVRIEEPYPFSRRACDDLCLAVLDMEGVTSVTVADPDGATTFRLVPVDKADPARLATPRDPGGFVEWGGSGGDSGLVEAQWRARLAGPERLVSGAPPARADYTLGLAAEEILRGQEVIARRTVANVAVPILPPFLMVPFSGADTGFAAGGLTLATEHRRIGPDPGGEHPYALFGQWLALRDYDQSLASRP
jgi:hypothetical protein